MPRPGRLRRSLRASTAEGVLAEIVGAFSSGTVLTAWAIHLGCSTVQLALLAALPNVAHVVRLPGAWLVERLTPRRLAIPAVAASRLLLLPLALLPCFGLSLPDQRTFLLVIAALTTALAVLGNCGWTVWMGDLVPQRLRARYFGRRTAACTLASMVALFAASVVIDAARASGHEATVLALLALLATLAGTATWALLLRQHEPHHQRAAAGTRALLDALTHAATRRLLRFSMGWNAAMGVSAAFFTLYMLEALHVGFAWLALHGAVLATMRMATAAAWGRAIDRHGCRIVLTVCSLSLALAPLPWLLLTRDRLWLLCLDPLWVGTFTSGHSLAMFEWPLRLTPRRGRSFHLALLAMAGGVAFAASAALGGALATRAGHGMLAGYGIDARPETGMRVLFAVGAAARAAGAWLAWRIMPGRQSQPRRVS